MIIKPIEEVMTEENRFELRYRTGDIPWEHGIPDVNLTEMVDQRPIPHGKALEVGCGNGENAIWLARQDFSVTACDISPTAIAEAQRRAEASGVRCSFHVLDFFCDPVPAAPFSFVFDRGCLHSFDTIEQRRQFAAKVYDYLERDGLWMTIAGSADTAPRDVGPPQLTAVDLLSSVEAQFEVLSLSAGHFGSDQIDPQQAWICLMRRRNIR